MVVQTHPKLHNGKKQSKLRRSLVKQGIKTHTILEIPIKIHIRADQPQITTKPFRKFHPKFPLSPAKGSYGNTNGKGKANGM